MLHAVARERPDATSDEMCREYNRRVGREGRTNPTSFLRAMKREGYVLKKKRQRPSECDRPDVRAKREAFRGAIAQIDPRRLVPVDEAGVNIAMGRSHAWVQRPGIRGGAPDELG